jgi:hypothetical protein
MLAAEYVIFVLVYLVLSELLPFHGKVFNTYLMGFPLSLSVRSFLIESLAWNRQVMLFSVMIYLNSQTSVHVSTIRNVADISNCLCFFLFFIITCFHSIIFMIISPRRQLQKRLNVKTMFIVSCCQFLSRQQKN